MYDILIKKNSSTFQLKNKKKVIQVISTGKRGLQGPQGDPGDSATNLVHSVNGHIGDVVLGKSDIGLPNVDNTSDANKPISSATQTALDSKLDDSATTADIPDSANKRYVTDAQRTVIQNTSGANTGDQDLSGLVPKTTTVNGHALSANVTVSKSDVGLGNADNTSDANKPVSTAQASAIAVVQSDVDTHEADTANPHAVTKTQVGLGNADNTSDVNKPVSTAQQTALDLKINTSVLDTDGTLAGNSDLKVATQKAVKTYADALIAANDALVYKGVIDASANPNYPAASAGHLYKISVAGKIGGASGVNVEAGDTILCLVDSTASGNQATVGANWDIIQVNLDGAVIGPTSATDNGIARFDLTTGKLIQNSGATIDDSGNITATNVSGTNTGNETTTTEGALINGATSKATPVDADYMGLMDSAASNILKKLSWANLKATLKTYFDSLTTTLTNKTLTSPVINTPTGIVKGDVGLGSVDNTSDATKNAAAATLTNKIVQWTPLPGVDLTVSGETAQFTTNEAQAFGDLVYVDSSGKSHIAKADAIATAKVIGMAIGTYGSAATGTYLLRGFARNDAWNWTVGGLVYLTITGTTGNTLSQTAPTATNNCVVIIGVAVAADEIYVNPQLVIVELT